MQTCFLTNDTPEVGDKKKRASSVAPTVGSRQTLLGFNAKDKEQVHKIEQVMNEANLQTQSTKEETNSPAQLSQESPYPLKYNFTEEKAEEPLRLMNK